MHGHTRGLDTFHALRQSRLTLPFPEFGRILDRELLALGRGVEKLAHLGESAIRLQAQVVLGGDDADGVGVAHAAAPALDTDNTVTFGEDAEFHGLLDAPLQSLVDILLPVDAAEVGFRFREAEWVHTAVEVCISGSFWVTCYHYDGADWAIFGEKTG